MSLTYRVRYKVWYSLRVYNTSTTYILFFSLLSLVHKYSLWQHPTQKCIVWQTSHTVSTYNVAHSRHCRGHYAFWRSTWSTTIMLTVNVLSTLATKDYYGIYVNSLQKISNKYLTPFIRKKCRNSYNLYSVQI